VVLRWGLRPLVSWHSVSFFERDVSLIRPEVHARIPLEVRRVEHPADVRRLEDYFEHLGRAPAEVATRLAEGDECFIGLHEGRVVHFAWLSRGPVMCPEVHVMLRLEPGEIYQGDSFTDESVRGHRVTAAVMTALLRWLHAQGYHREYFYVARNNHASLRALDSVPRPRSVVTRTMRSFRLLGTGGFLVTGLDANARPALHLAAGLQARRLGRFGYLVRRRTTL